MEHKLLIFSIGLLALCIPLLISQNVFADNGPGPVVPTGNNTVTQYCYSGICSTNGTRIILNSTQGFYSPGVYPGGVPLYHVTDIAIQESQTCLALLKLHLPSHCLPYNILKPLDNTNPVYAGEWINDTYYHRLPPRVANHYQFNPNPFTIMVDPNPDFTTRARTITVTNNNFTWINPDEIAANGLVVTHVNRAVLGCESATVAPILWLVNDTIHYLESGCTKTSYNDTLITHQNPIPFNNTNPYSSLYFNSYLKTVLNGHSSFSVNATGGAGPKNCITQKCDTPKDPYHTHDSKFGWN